MIGHWRAHNPWYPNFRIVARRSALHLIWGWGDEEWELVPLPAGGYRVGAEEWSPGRISFDTVVDGAVTRRPSTGRCTTERSRPEARGGPQEARRKATTAFWPPNPNELESAKRREASRASLGT